MIDNCFFNSHDFHTVSGNVIYDLIDRLPNFLTINESNFLLDSKEKIFRQDLSSLNVESLLSNFTPIQWEQVFRETQNVNQLFEVFLCLGFVDKYLPLRKLSRGRLGFLFANPVDN